MSNDLIAALRRYDELFQHIDIDDERHEVAEMVRRGHVLVQALARALMSHERRAVA